VSEWVAKMGEEKWFEVQNWKWKILVKLIILRENVI
jgi:hypothetical protein